MTSGAAEASVPPPSAAAEHPAVRDRAGLGALGLLGADVAACAAVSAAFLPLRPALLLLLFLQLTSLALYGLYADPRARMATPTLGELGRLTGALTTAGWAFFLTAQLLGWGEPELLALAVASLVGVPALGLARFSVRWASARAGTVERALVVGAGSVGQRLALELLPEQRRGVKVVGLLDPAPRELDPRLRELPLFTRVDDLERALELTGATRVVIAFSRLDTAAARSIARVCDRRGVDLDVVPRLFELYANRARLDSLGGIPLLGLPPVRPSVLERSVKRALDIVAAAVLLILLAPLFAVIGLAVRIDSPGRAVFTHLRVGHRGKTFRMAKFRTMSHDAELRAQRLLTTGSRSARRKLLDDTRVTRVGRVLRSTSLDELPQLWNVLRGDMSLIGPRPLPLYEYVGREDADGLRVEVPPGMSGLWQVLGRSEIGFDERMRLDYLYARNRTLAWDIRLLCQTIAAVIRRTGAY